MVTLFSRLFSYYRAYHQPSPLLLRYMIVFGIVGLPAMYLLRFARGSGSYDDLMLRLVDVALMAILAVRAWWPDRLKPYYLHFSYVVMTVTLPLTFVFTSLMNGGGAGAVGNTFMAVFMLLLLSDWRNMIVMLLAGFGGATGLYLLMDPTPNMPMDYVTRLPLLLVSVGGGCVFKYALEQTAIERVRQAYASLAGSIAHEMRNPMAQVRHSLEHIRQALPVPSLHEQAQLVEGRKVEQLYRHVAQGEMAVRRGLQVIAMTLDEVNAKPLDPGRMAYLSAAEVCGKAVEEYGYENEQQRARVAVEVREDFVFSGDETAFLFVLFNLMKNALFYLPAYPEARLQIIVAAGSISVRDTGPGIAPELVASLFEPFRTSGKAGGTGLGLAYCRRVMRALGGEIRCDSELGRYTEFTMTFPPVEAGELAAQREAAIAEARRLYAGWHMLVVDDDALLRTSAVAKLRAVCDNVDEADGGVAALAALRRTKYDIVVLDLNMPGMSGYEVAELLRSGEVPINRQTCLVAHTSEPSHLTRVKVENAGFDGFVGKPVDQLGLVQAVRRAVQARERSRWRADGWLAGRRLLLADDNSYNRSAVAAYLKHAGATVTEVSSGHAALRELRNYAGWHAVILDIHMPGMNGVDVARAIRAIDGVQKDVPILAITAHAGADVVAAATAAGIGDFVTKPVDAPLMYEKLARLMGLKAPQPDAAGTPEQARATAAASADEPLLDEHRLHGYQRVGMLEDLLDEYIPQINALIDRLAAAVDERDLQSTTDCLHSLVGMSGEAGAHALHRYSRGIYVPMLERQQWPDDAHWLARLRDLTARSNKALQEWVATNSKAAVG